MAKLAIVGTGFVGTSLGLAIRPSKLFETIAGYDRDRGQLQAAKRRGAIDEEARSASRAADGAAVVVLAGSDVEEALRDVVPGLSAGAVVTETSLWKVPAARLAADILPAGVEFVGGRPGLDGGSEPSAEAFRNAIYCLTPGAQASEPAIDAMSTVASAAGAQPDFLDPAEHDALTAAGELLPAAMLACLATAVTGDAAWTDAGRLAGDRFNQLALLAEDLPAGFWQEAAKNSDALARWLDAAAAALLDLRDRLQDGQALAQDWRATTDALARWRRDKRQLQESTMPPKAELRPSLFGALGKRPSPPAPR